ncbi:MAG: glycosyltransferase family 2 protein, partial [Flavobacteriaceae bacterium]
MKEIAIVILNYNGRKLLQEFLPSVISHSTEASIYVIDNRSEDDSVDWLKTQYIDQLTVISLSKNYGFAGGYNEGLKKVNEPYWCLLNSDVRVTNNYISRPLEVLKTNPDIAAVQPKVRSERQPDYFEYAGAAGGFLDYLGYPYCRGRLFQRIEKDNGQYDDEMEVFWTTGACMFIKRSAFEEAGGFDTTYFAHQEEIDLCWRLHHRGLKLLYTSKSTVYHLGGST